MRMQITDDREVGFDDIGQGEPLVLLHGIMSDRSVFQTLASKLASDFRVISVDLRGHGESTAGPNYELEEFANDVLALLAALEVPSASFMGWSMGGIVAMELALRRADLVDRLVLVGSTPCLVRRPDWEPALPPEAAASLVEGLQEDWSEGARRFVANVLGDSSDDVHEDYLRMACAARPDVALACFDSIGGLDMRPRMGVMPMPVATIVGSEDRICPAAASAYLASVLGGTQCVIPGAGHAPFLTAATPFESEVRRALARRLL